MGRQQLGYRLIDEEAAPSRAYRCVDILAISALVVAVAAVVRCRSRTKMRATGCGCMLRSLTLALSPLPPLLPPRPSAPALHSPPVPTGPPLRGTRAPLAR